MGTPSCNTAIFTKGNNFRDFLFTSQMAKAKSIFQELAPISKGGKKENEKSCFP